MGVRRWTYRQLKRPFFGRYMRPWRWPAGVEREPYAPVTVRARNGAQLAALVRRARPARSAGVLVLAHPMGLAAKGFWLKHGHADAFAAAGFDLVSFDFNGFGESELDDFDYPGDLLAVGEFAREHFAPAPVSVVGASFGAMRALEAASTPEAPFASVVAESVAPTLPDFWRHYPVPYAVLMASRWIYPPWERRLRPVACLERLRRPIPVLLIHSRADVYTPPAHGDVIERVLAGRAPVTRLVVDGAEHTHALRDARDAYLAAVLPFLRAAHGVT